MSIEIAFLFSAMLSSEDIPGVLRLVSAAEAAGRLSAEKADAWRMLLAAAYGYHSLRAGPLSSESCSSGGRRAAASRFPPATSPLSSNPDAA